MYYPPRVGSRETKVSPTTPSLVGKLRFPYDPFLSRETKVSPTTPSLVGKLRFPYDPFLSRETKGRDSTPTTPSFLSEYL